MLQPLLIRGRAPRPRSIGWSTPDRDRRRQRALRAEQIVAHLGSASSTGRVYV
jgi:hypothetical protein